MNVYALLLFSCLLLLKSSLVSGQGFRCTPGNRSPFCTPIQPRKFGYRAVLGKPDDPIGDITKTLPLEVQAEPIVCSPLYRTIDGSCTNLANPEFGTAGTAQFSYIEGSTSIEPNGDNRPSARLVSNIVADQGDIDMPNSRGLTLFFVFFGQFLDHDLVLTPVNTSEPFNIPVPAGDPIFANLSSPRGNRYYPYATSGYSDESSSVSELPFSRSVRASTSAFDPNLQRPVNSLTSPIDLSEVYGSSEERFDLLRVEGSCKMLTSGGGRYLPLNTPRTENEPTDSDTFFLAGDIRSNENPALTSFHTVFIREHNRLCDELEKDFPLESQIELFQLARKVNIFQMQRIVYEEFLPAIMGRQIQIGPFNPNVNPSVSDIFSTAAFRLGHTMVGDTLPTGNPRIPFLTARDMFFRTARTYLSISRPGPFLRGSAQTVAQEVDVMVVDALRNFLFSNVDELTGIDLISLNLQRGRDHALPSYNTVRNIFGLPTITRFSDVTSDVALQFRLSRTYAKVDDMDLWIALLAEDHVRGASMGETMFRVWEAEFRRLAEGDRFFYTTDDLFDENFKQTFTRFDEISKTKTLMRDILVRNTGRVRFPKSVFRRSGGVRRARRAGW